MKILFSGFPINLIILVTGQLELWNVFSLSDFSAFLAILAFSPLI